MKQQTGNLVAYFDGACEPKNPGGNLGIGATIRHAGKEIFRHSSFVKAAHGNTNNIAEYMAIEAIFDFMLQNAWAGEEVTIYGDSKLVIEQLFGRWTINRGFYVKYAVRCRQKLNSLRGRGLRITGILIRREQNKYADELSKAELINHNVTFKIQPLTLNPNQ